MLTNASVSSLFYMAVAVICLILFHLRSGLVWRQTILGSFGITVFLSQATELVGLALVFTFPLLSLILILLIAKLRLKLILVSSVSFLILFFITVKQYWFFPELSFFNAFLLIGLSYMLFRAIHVMVEVQNGVDFGSEDIGRYIRYQVSPFNFFAGPINDYEDYVDDENRMAEFKLSGESLTGGLSRLLIGLVKIIAISPFLISSFTLLRGMGELYFILTSVLFIAYIYVNFSGYMDVVIGISRMFGIKIPENFNRPWMADSFTNFWTRWHITLSFFFRDYLFFPLLKVGARYTNSRLGLTSIGTIVSFCAFFLLGVWHGTTHMFIYLGCALGFGVAANYLYSELVSSKCNPGKMAQLFLNHISGACAVVYFGLSSALVWPEVTNLDQMINEISSLFTIDGLIGLVAVICLLVLLRLLTSVLDTIVDIIEPVFVRFRPIAVGVLLVATYLLYEITASAPPPHIYYEDF